MPDQSMSDRLEMFCLADRTFYDTSDRLGPDANDEPFRTREVPAGWDHDRSDIWMYYMPRDRALPAQGWKIHVSACLDDAERAIDAVWDYCVPRGIAFKFLRSRAVLVMLNAKSAFRGSSGKLLTIYPTDEAALERILTELDEILRGVRGPYVLSDLRYAAGPLYVRYGGFVERFCLAGNGEQVLALEDPAGQLVPDVRGPTFALPTWLALPAFLEPHLAARNAVTVDAMPYTVESVLQFSNGGGVYLGRDRRTQERVVLKEGRPHAGLDRSGRDAVQRLSHERDILTRLAGLDVVPAVLDYIAVGEHHFLVEEFVDGNPLQRLLVHRYPLTHPDCTDADLAEYTVWAERMLGKVEDAVAQLHARGVVFGDLHPQNVLVTPDERLVLIDFEVASLADDDAQAVLAHPAFAPPADRRGVHIDRYALGCLRLNMFAPQTTTTLALYPGKAAHLAALVREQFPVTPQPVAAAVAVLTGDAGADPVSQPMPGRADWVDVRSALATAVLASATPDRSDRLFPGDPAQFGAGGGIALAHGAAGVLYALAATDAGRFPEHEDWLRKHALAPPAGTGIGFWDGLHGVAFVLDALGHRPDALQVLDRCLEDWGRHEPAADELDLHSGLAGVGLNLLHFAERTGDPGVAAAARRVVDRVADRLGTVDSVPQISGGEHPRAGLLFGSAGPALLFLRAFEQSGDGALLDLAEVALRQDLRRCVLAPDGTLQVDQGWRTLPYLDEGSAGIALVLDRYLYHRPDDELAVDLDRLRGVLRAGFFVQPGLFTGRAGIIAVAGMLDDRPAAGALVPGLAWHALPYGGGLAFPGEQLLRLSMDLATGTAGVLLALGTALADTPVHLPFLEPPRGGPRHPDPIGGSGPVKKRMR